MRLQRVSIQGRKQLCNNVLGTTTLIHPAVAMDIWENDGKKVYSIWGHGCHSYYGQLKQWLVFDEETEKQYDEIQYQIRLLMEKQVALIVYNKQKFKWLTVEQFQKLRDENKRFKEATKGGAE